MVARNFLWGRWSRIKAAWKARFGTLVDEDLTIIAGKRDQLIRTLRETYGIAHEEAESRVKQWEQQQKW